VCDGKGRPLIMLLSEGQMGDFGSAVLMIDAFPKAKALLSDTEHRAVPRAREDAQDMMPIGSVSHWLAAKLKRAFPRNQTAKSTSRMTPLSTDNVTKSRSCLGGSKTGDASTPAMTDALILSCPQSASPPQSSSGSINES
jgi:hypothetical protein